MAQAYRHLRRASALSPDPSFELYLGSFALYFASLETKNKTKNLNIAAKSLENAIRNDDLSVHHHGIAYFLRGLTYLLNHQFKQAIKALNKAERLERASSTAFDSDRPKPSLLTQIKKYRAYARRGESSFGPLHVKLEFKFADQIFGW